MNSFKLLGLCAFLLVALVQLTYAASGCDNDFCRKEELFRCDDSKDDDKARRQCIDAGKMYVTFKSGLLSHSHKCCAWEVKDIPNRYLSCVRTMRTRYEKCTSDGDGNYDIKFKSKGDCKKFTCNKVSTFA